MKNIKTFLKEKAYQWLSALSFLGVIVLFSMNYSAPKVAFVKTDVLMTKYTGMIEAKAKYKLKADTWQANIDTLKSQLDSAIMTYQKLMPALSPSQRIEKEGLLQRKQQEFIKYSQTIKQQAEQEDKKMTEGVLKKVNTFLQDYGRNKGYSLIFGANGDGSIIYGKTAIDITEEVLIKLNENNGN